VKFLALVVALTLGAVRPVYAEPPGLVPPLETRAFDQKSQAVATGLTLVGIVAPIGIMALGTTNIDEGGVFGLGMIASIPGPAMGHWYTNHVGTYGMLGRFVALSTILAGINEIADAKRCARGEQVADGCDGVSRGVGRGMIGVGAALYASSWAFDFVTSRSEVRRWNALRTIQLKPLTSLGLGRKGLTVGLSLRFDF
jgi:hypothetical protein